MELKVFWSDTAQYQLEDIFDFLKHTANTIVAKKIVNKIIDKSFLLENSPQIGQIEELLKHRKFQYRYIVEGNYKIIYFIDEKLIIIASVFDTRMNPKKLSRL